MIPLYDENPYRRFPLVTLLLILANIWITWQTFRQPELRQIEVAYTHGFVPARLTHVGEPKPLQIRQNLELQVRPNQPPAPVAIKIDLSNDTSDVYQSVLTSMFLHGGWLHLISNMWMLWVFGNNIEDKLGHWVFAAFYVAGGVIAALSHWMIDPESQMPMIGASGAVAAVLGAYALTYPWAKVKTLVFLGLPLIFSLPAFVTLGLWMLMETFLGIMQVQLGIVAGVAHWAHIGGFIAGLILMPLLAVGRPPDGQDWNKETDELFQFEPPKPLTERHNLQSNQF